MSVAAYNCASDSCSAESAGAAAGFFREPLDVEVAAAARFFGGIAVAASAVAASASAAADARRETRRELELPL